MLPPYKIPECARPPKGKKPTQPFEPHNHRCSKCGLIWHHDPAALMPAPGASEAEFDAANEAYRHSHECPTCGTEMHYIDQTGTPAQCIFDGKCKPQKIEVQPVYEDDFQTLLKRSLLAATYEQEATKEALASSV